MHIILESVRSFGLKCGPHLDHNSENPAITVPASAARKELLVYTANRSESVGIGMNHLGNFIKSNQATIDDIAFTLALHREHLSWRTFAVSNGIDRPEFSTPIKISSGKHSSDVAFVFTGQGAQWATSKSSYLFDRIYSCAYKIQWVLA